jgi:ribose 5-phosphate isomerase A
MAPDRATARHQPPLNDDAVLTEGYKRAAAEAAARIVQDGMRVGLGTGSTVAFLLPALAERKLHGLRCVATSPVTERMAQTLGLKVEDLNTVGELDIAIDGADQVDPSGWLVKGGGAALTREKIVAAAARRFVVIVSEDKPVAALRPPVPLELLRFGVQRTLAEIGEARLRLGNETQSRGVPSSAGETQASTVNTLESPDGNLIADYFGPIGDPASLASRLSATPGVVEHGLFAPGMVSYIWIAGAGGVKGREGGKAASGRSSSSGATE